MMKYFRLLVLGWGIFMFMSCGKKDKVVPIIIEPPYVPPTTNNFLGPTYSDNYTSIAGWENRSSWNLANVHDPTVVKDGDYFYMYQTNASYGNAHDLNGTSRGLYMCRRSKDLVNWEFRDFAFSAPPSWVKDTLNAKRTRMGLQPISNPKLAYWAPCVRKVGSKFRMYYTVVVDELIIGTSVNNSWGERPYIGLAETDNLAGNVWVDKGMVVCSEAEPGRSYLRSGGNDWSSYYKFNAIDPSFIATPEGDQWLFYGSWMTGLAALKLNPITGKPDKLDTITDYGMRIAGRGNLTTNRWQALEAGEIVYNDVTGYYYLFMAYDELSVAYNTRVARSRNITGPYVGINGADVSAGAECWPMVTHPYAFASHTGWVGVSHCAIFQDPTTKEWFFFSQGRLPENVAGINVSNAVMMGQVRQIRWTEDGWPTVDPERYAAVPKTNIGEKDLVGNWEEISMEYQYKIQQRSSTIMLSADKKVSGAITGTWSLDSVKQILYVNSIDLKLANAWDWESSPRKTTITFSGYNSAGKPMWGKKL